jgi:teichuronic acid biosynthesis glycosyltransferase TuaG
MANNKCLISIAIPVYNGSDFLEKTIESIIGQSESEYIEIVLSDDCSTDSSSRIAQRIRRQIS